MVALKPVERTLWGWAVAQQRADNGRETKTKRAAPPITSRRGGGIALHTLFTCENIWDKRWFIGPRHIPPTADAQWPTAPPQKAVLTPPLAAPPPACSG